MIRLFSVRQRRNIMSRMIFRIPEYAKKMHTSEQTQKNKRIVNRYFIDTKKENKNTDIEKEINGEKDI